MAATTTTTTTFTMMRMMHAALSAAATRQSSRSRSSLALAKTTVSSSSHSPSHHRRVGLTVRASSASKVVRSASASASAAAASTVTSSTYCWKNAETNGSSRRRRIHSFSSSSSSSSASVEDSSIEQQQQEEEKHGLISKPEFCWLDLRGTNLSMIERLSLEEAILRHDAPSNKNWIIVGTHHVWPPKHLNFFSASSSDHLASTTSEPRKLSIQNFPEYLLDDNIADDTDDDAPDTKTTTTTNINTDCMVVMGIGGKPDSLLHSKNVEDDKIMVVKRFSGGGTVVLDENSIWTTIIGRTTATSATKKTESTFASSVVVDVEPYPRSIMEWTASEVFGPMFEKMTTRKMNENRRRRRRRARRQNKIRVNRVMNKKQEDSKKEEEPKKTKTIKTLVLGNKGCCGLDHSGKNSFLTIERPDDDDCEDEDYDDDDDDDHLDDEDYDDESPEIPLFSLRENDYILGDDLKMGGNAQSISKDGWLHHTSFLWDYNVRNMERYLKLPEKRPEYRESRSHGDFLTKLAPIFGHEDEDNDTDDDDSTSSLSSSSHNTTAKKHDPFFDSLYDACTESFDLQKVSFEEVQTELIDQRLGGMDSWFEQNRTKIV